MLKAGSPAVTSTSTDTSAASIPITAAESTRASMAAIVGRGGERVNVQSAIHGAQRCRWTKPRSRSRQVTFYTNLQQIVSLADLTSNQQQPQQSKFPVSFPVIYPLVLGRECRFALALNLQTGSDRGACHEAY